jgi:phenylpropionate dioxygenase-like ring-hydroxylating dioxygenase large terminal subunit
MQQPVQPENPVPDQLSLEDFRIPPTAYISRDYAAREYDKLWSKVWQMVCRLEEIANVGDFVTYDILDQSVIVVRSAPDTISAYHNVCPHRGRRLTEGCGNEKRFACKFHGWKWSLDGKNTSVLAREDWEGSLTDQDLRLQTVKVDTWAGYVFINLDSDCEPLRSYLEPAATLLAPYEIQSMRYRWRRWIEMPCNWKVALEAFTEGYHVPGTHPQLLAFTDHPSWSNAWGKHGNFGMAGPPEARMFGEGSPLVHPEPRTDVREALATYYRDMKRDLDAFMSDAEVAAAQRLLTEMPAGTTAMEAFLQMMRWAEESDAAKGIHYPPVPPEHYALAGTDWHVFPNIVILQTAAYVLGYRARPIDLDPDHCLFEVYTLHRFPPNQEPKGVRNEHVPDFKDWPLILQQDFQNMAAMQRGLHSKAFKGSRPSPKQERAVANFHKTLERYMTAR